MESGENEEKPRQLGAHREGEEPRTGAAVSRGRRANEPFTCSR